MHWNVPPEPVERSPTLGKHSVVKMVRKFQEDSPLKPMKTISHVVVCAYDSIFVLFGSFWEVQSLHAPQAARDQALRAATAANPAPQRGPSSVWALLLELVTGSSVRFGAVNDGYQWVHRYQ